MISVASPYLWYLSRATGIVSLCLLTVVMVLGIGTATRAGGRFLLRFEVAELHRRLSLLAVLFVAVHVFSTVIDSYVPTGLAAAFIPGASSYKPLPVAIGAVALDLLIAVSLTSALRKRISPAAWRAVHWLSYLCWPIAVLHTVQIGSDMKHSWMDIVVLACITLVGAAGIRRIAWHQGAVPDGARTVLHPHPRGAAAPSRSPRETCPPPGPGDDRRRVASSRRWTGAAGGSAPSAAPTDDRRSVASSRRPT